MHLCSSQTYVLEHFLRLNTRRPETWLSALQVLTQSPGLSQKLLSDTSGSSFRARLSFLPSPSLNACGTYLKAACQVSGTNANSMALIMPVAGTVSFEVADDRYLCPPWTPFVLDPHEDFQANLSADSHVLIAQMANLGEPGFRHLLRHDQPSLRRVLASFLYETPFFRSYDHAMARLEHLGNQLYALVEGQLPLVAMEGGRRVIGDDRRLCRAIELLNRELGTDIHIESIASRSGLSLRNLHYLMRQHTGQSPYQYIRGRRLVFAREAIIRDYPGGTSIAQHAMNWGFQHAGRFAGYYLKHFGEYPNQTLSELDRLEQYRDQVLSLKNGARGSSQYWLSSAATPDYQAFRRSNESSREEC